MSKYMEARDLRGEELHGVVESVDSPGGVFLVLRLEGVDKGVIIDWRTVGLLAPVLGDNVRKWPGREVTLFPDSDHRGPTIGVRADLPRRGHAPFHPHIRHDTRPRWDIPRTW